MGKKNTGNILTAGTPLAFHRLKHPHQPQVTVILENSLGSFWTSVLVCYGHLEERNT